MSVGKIALGVFLGNLAFGALAWIAVATVAEDAHTKALVGSADADYSAMVARAHSDEHAPRR